MNTASMSRRRPIATSKTLAQVGMSGCERTQTVLTSTSTPPMEERIRRNVGFSAWGRMTIEIAQGEPQHDVGTERNEKDRVRDAAYSLHPGPQFGTRLRGVDVRVARGRANLEDDLQNDPNSSRDEHGP